ncbi:STAS domain-containing protein [Actinophytocola gossypii]|uniref:Anti-sigma factor antagonist n=1 Tax=Actinophytocola gossypii TaxID=2812003 RepID=A0ABT2JK49_9PSEU|nr:STAS domain-containing protein [Actinophytocola gossypii]MCT2587755.1 STAS domain-containing protein [Actinophytocola gossypii]
MSVTYLTCTRARRRASAPPLRFAVTRPSTTATVIEVAGEIDLATVSRVDVLLDQYPDEGIRDLVLDLSAVTFLGAAGLAALARVDQRMRDAGRRLRLIIRPGSVDRVLCITGLDRRLACYSAVAGAIEGVAE